MTPTDAEALVEKALAHIREADVRVHSYSYHYVSSEMLHLTVVTEGHNRIAITFDASGQPTVSLPYPYTRLEEVP